MAALALSVDDSRTPVDTEPSAIADLIIAAVAERHRVTVLHYDADYDLIAEITGQPTQWVVPRGSVP